MGNEFTNNIILDEEQFEKISKGQIKIYSDQKINDLDNIKYDFLQMDNKVSYKSSKNTDSRLKATCISNCNYLCQINNEHRTFTNINGEHQYMECHHIIPICAQVDEEFRYIKLDRLFNLVCLCLICHTQMHYCSDKEKEEIFNKIFIINKEVFESVGMDLNILKKFI